MSRRIRPMPEPRWWSKAQLASHLSKSVSWLDDNYRNLVLQGMPAKDDLLNAFDSVAVINWENQRSGLIGNTKDERSMIDKVLQNGQI